MKKLRFGTAGIPLSTPEKGTLAGIEHVRRMGLDSMEMEFVRSVYVKEGKTEPIKQLAKAQDVALTCHGSYFINLNAQEEKKIAASKQRVNQAAKILSLCGGYSMTFHAAFYLKQDPLVVYKKVEQGFKDIIKDLQDEGHNTVWVRPETTGKPTQWGDLQETIKLSQNVEQVLPCVDFSHLHARTNGKNNTTAEFQAQLTAIEKGLGREALDNMHIHLSGINYGPKGEKNHLILEESDMNYKDLLRVWKEFKIKGVVTCESPNIEKDALLLQKYWKGL